MARIAKDLGVDFYDGRLDAVFWGQKRGEQKRQFVYGNKGGGVYSGESVIR